MKRPLEPSIFFALACAMTCAVAGCGSTSDEDTDTRCPISVTTETTGKQVNISDPTFGGTSIAQSFKVQSDLTIVEVELGLRRVGKPNGDLTLRIETSSGSVPSGSLVGAGATGSFTVTTNNATNVGNLDESSTSFESLPLDSPISFTASTTNLYWLRVSSSYGASSTDAAQWAANDTNIFTSGGAFYFTGTTFANTKIGANRDLLFKLCKSLPE